MKPHTIKFSTSRPLSSTRHVGRISTFPYVRLLPYSRHTQLCNACKLPDDDPDHVGLTFSSWPARKYQRLFERIHQIGNGPELKNLSNMRCPVNPKIVKGFPLAISFYCGVWVNPKTPSFKRTYNYLKFGDLKLLLEGSPHEKIFF